MPVTRPTRQARGLSDALRALRSISSSSRVAAAGLSMAMYSMMASRSRIANGRQSRRISLSGVNRDAVLFDALQMQPKRHHPQVTLPDHRDWPELEIETTFHTQLPDGPSSWQLTGPVASASPGHRCYIPTNQSLPHEYPPPAGASSRATDYRKFSALDHAPLFHVGRSRRDSAPTCLLRTEASLISPRRKGTVSGMTSPFSRQP